MKARLTVPVARLLPAPLLLFISSSSTANNPGSPRDLPHRRSHAEENLQALRDARRRGRGMSGRLRRLRRRPITSVSSLTASSSRRTFTSRRAVSSATRAMKQAKTRTPPTRESVKRPSDNLEALRGASQGDRGHIQEVAPLHHHRPAQQGGQADVHGRGKIFDGKVFEKSCRPATPPAATAM